MKKLSQKLAAAMTSGIVLSSSTMAFAGAQNFDTMTANIVDASKGLPNLISLVGYIGGTALGVAGIFKIKMHVDNPSQTPLKDGCIRLAAGGALLALPFLSTAMQQSIAGADNAVVNFTALDTVDTVLP